MWEIRYHSKPKSQLPANLGNGEHASVIEAFATRQAAVQQLCKSIVTGRVEDFCNSNSRGRGRISW